MTIPFLSGADQHRLILSVLSERHFSEYASDIHHLLSKSELTYYQNLTYETRQKSYLLGRMATKEAIASLSGETNWCSIEIQKGIFEQPVAYVKKSAGPMHISISHTDHLAGAIAFSSLYPMGLDMETIGDNDHESLCKYLTSRELHLLENQPYPETVMSLAFWTVKEALSKVLKCGLTVAPEILEIDQCTINSQNKGLVCTYTQFKQYQCRSWIFDHVILSLVYPHMIELQISEETTQAMESLFT